MDRFALSAAKCFHLCCSTIWEQEKNFCRIKVDPRWPLNGQPRTPLDTPRTELTNDATIDPQHRAYPGYGARATLAGDSDCSRHSQCGIDVTLALSLSPHRECLRCSHTQGSGRSRTFSAQVFNVRRTSAIAPLCSSSSCSRAR